MFSQLIYTYKYNKRIIAGGDFKQWTDGRWLSANRISTKETKHDTKSSYYVKAEDKAWPTCTKSSKKEKVNK